ncbi:predicted protein [Coccidioides posadasii C735 delta SOWgp]|nr:predicted protein [Coccidioides posadasii C735 delta SOWgp]EER29073.1 predicted protein [Coccidioides posadasii C735 delta SOWgp]|eukprot:XP_003071218.1 predicted protein [Coccidioides posadasii C735 delta SOWgp]
MSGHRKGIPHLPKRYACDRCRKHKLRCPREAQAGDSCPRCLRAGAQCVTSTALPLGRPARSRTGTPSTQTTERVRKRDQSGSGNIVFRTSRQQQYVHSGPDLTAVPPAERAHGEIATEHSQGPLDKSLSWFQTSDPDIPGFEPGTLLEIPDADSSFGDSMMRNANGPDIPPSSGSTLIGFHVPEVLIQPWNRGRTDSQNDMLREGGTGLGSGSLQHVGCGDGLQKPGPENKSQLGELLQRTSKILGILQASALSKNCFAFSNLSTTSGPRSIHSQPTSIMGPSVHATSSPQRTPAPSSTTRRLMELNTSEPKLDTATILIISAYYIQIIQIYNVIFAQSHLEFYQTSGPSISRLQVLPGPQLGLPLEHGGMRAEFMIQAINHLLDRVEILQGMPPKFRLNPTRGFEVGFHGLELTTLCITNDYESKRK